MDELTTSIVGIDFPNEDKSKSNRRMESMLCAPGDVVELRLEPQSPTMHPHWAAPILHDLKRREERT